MQPITSAKESEIINDRIIWKRQADTGPVLVIFAGIHGNELAGVLACDHVIPKLESGEYPFEGSVYMLTGNKKAIENGARFLDRDLNRIWNEFDDLGELKKKEGAEFDEAEELLETIRSIIRAEEADGRQIFFVDLHTTSAQSCAFIPFNDTLANRKIAHKFPVPQILGIEEFIQGTLLSYINDLGYPCIGFEAGAHTDPVSVERAESFLWLCLHELSIVELEQEEVKAHQEVLTTVPDIPDTYYEITYHHYVEDASRFYMKRGYTNFDRIDKEELLAYEDGERIHAPFSGLIFMPLYQAKGNDGFFIIKPRSPFWLQLSEVLRDSFLNNILAYLPGVRMNEEGNFEVNLKIARFLVKEIFHLLGYRVIRKQPYLIEAYKRDR
ncbi:succinylglutamate desuccinylase/aspartoacylase family protein [Balneola sp. MJW-20]|uniref:succinylglutamate desuccinylase/aspartoacylase family protein n=1 Tax=Gracilimonas aurantiaca TaxID=3234185 RepID=UPI0034653353